MAGLVPATHELRIGRIRRVWVAGTRPAMTTKREKPSFVWFVWFVDASPGGRDVGGR